MSSISRISRRNFFEGVAEIRPAAEEMMAVLEMTVQEKALVFGIWAVLTDHLEVVLSLR
ncbi:hypothetical protein CERSUDRAFT_97350 [Gelatoporia subvermispora B]|uniref:Uncharacterized protein n=1 Tax=Ceriporiopsis subvermispora (strain B) TaxID=914234 RepID=M2R8J3_CERS8|nr:hypothetical protein CERSUDRAFT_97350 [Gelatoporia subvermispora B]